MGDYARKTAHLTLAQRGAYDALLDHYYSTRRSLPADLASLCRICNAQGNAETESVSEIVNEFFPLNGDGTRHNKRADEEIRRWNAQAIVNKEVGKLGGRPRKKTESVVEVRSQKLEVIYQKPENKKKGRRETETVELPDWIPRSQWDAWIEARTKRRNPPTNWAKQLAVRKLEVMREEGHSVALILANSAFNGWAGLFPPKETP
jgi:uncharacterized protein YdaU (DUF1376 family)